MPLKRAAGRPAIALNAAFLALAFLLLLSPVALGHAVLVKAEPAPFSTLTVSPSRVTVWASEPLNPRFSSVQVFDAQRLPVHAGASRVSSEDLRRIEVDLLPLKESIYTVVWTTNSQLDGHTLRGAYSFAVSPSGKPIFPQGTSQPTLPGEQARLWTSSYIVQTVAQWAILLSVLLLVGGLLFDLVVSRLLSARRRAAEGPDVSGLAEHAPRRWAGLERFLLIALPSSTVLATLALVANASGSWRKAVSPSFIWDFIISTPFGVATLLKIVVSLAVLAAGLSMARRNVPMLAMGLVFLGLLAFTGHAAAVEQPRFIPVGVDWLHLLAASAWLGGMVFLALALLPGRVKGRRVGPEWRPFLQVLQGFSPVAFVSVGLLLATGVYQSVTRLSGPGDLVSTGFGRVLVVKMGLVLAMLLMSLGHVFAIRPRLRAALERDARSPDTSGLALRLRRFLRWEPVLGVVVIGATALLSAFPPPGLGATAAKTGPPGATTGPAAAGPPRFSLAQKAEDTLVVVGIGPAEPGKNRIQILVSSAFDGGPLRGPVLVRLRATYLDQEAGSQFITTNSQPDGSFVGEADLFFSGRWRLEVIVRRQDKPDATASFTFLLPAVDATALLERAAKAMNSLQSVAQHEELDAMVGQIQVTDAEFQAPDRLYFRNQRDEHLYIIGDRQFLKAPGGQWQKGPTFGPRPYAWPTFNFREGWVQPVVVGSERLDGQPHSIVAVFDSRAGFYYLMWIGTDDNLVRRWKHFAPAHFIDSTFSNFNSTTISVTESELPR